MIVDLSTDPRFQAAKENLAPYVRMMGELLQEPNDLFATEYGSRVLDNDKAAVTRSGRQPTDRRALLRHIRERVELAISIRDFGYDPEIGCCPIGACCRSGKIGLTDGVHRTSILLYLGRPIPVDVEDVA